MTHHEWDHVQEASRAIRALWAGEPRVGIVLGTGLGALAREIEAEAAIPYPEIPHFPRSTVESHKGQLVCGNLAGHSVMAMEGRFHLYEGYSPWQVTFPIRVMKELGCRLLIVSNAAGGLNPLYREGGPGRHRGPHQPDGAQPPDRAQRRAARASVPGHDRALRPRPPGSGPRGGAASRTSSARRGVYVAVVGPNLETRAEYRFLRGIGADVVGMSTVPEVLVAVHAGLKVLGFSIVTDMCLPDALQPVRIEEIIAVANEAETKLRTIVRGVLERWGP